MAWTVPDRLLVPLNAEVVRYLEAHGPSAHSDVATELQHAVRYLPGVTMVCPDPARYSWVAAVTHSQRIFALARGSSSLAIRLHPASVPEALAEGALPCPEIGAGWVSFDPFQASEPTASTRRRIRRWCTIAGS